MYTLSLIENVNIYSRAARYSKINLDIVQFFKIIIYDIIFSKIYYELE